MWVWLEDIGGDFCFLHFLAIYQALCLSVLSHISFICVLLCYLSSIGTIFGYVKIKFQKKKKKKSGYKILIREKGVTHIYLYHCINSLDVPFSVVKTLVLKCINNINFNPIKFISLLYLFLN